MIMNATVLRTNAGSLLVRDMATGNEVMVFFNNARAFSPGDRIRITFSGAMTHSIPPQITATAIQRVQTPPTTAPSQTQIRRAVVLQVRRNSLLVRDPGNGNRQVVVNYAFAHHFCAGQRLNIQYDSIMLGNPVQVNATDITPIC